MRIREFINGPLEGFSLLDNKESIVVERVEFGLPDCTIKRRGEIFNDIGGMYIKTTNGCNDEQYQFFGAYYSPQKCKVLLV